MRLDRRIAKNVPETVYHYTAGFHLQAIMDSGVIRTTESNIQWTGAGPPVVWLSDADGSRFDWAAGGAKGEIRFLIVTQGLPIYYWPVWSRSQGIEEDWYHALAVSGGDPDSWWVCTSPIPDDSWWDVEVYKDGRFVPVMDVLA
jgi:hypothetical protein